MMKRTLSVYFLVLMAISCVPPKRMFLHGQTLPDAPQVQPAEKQPSLLHDFLFVTAVNAPHLAGLALDAQSTNVDVNIARCCYESHDFLYGRYPTLGRLSGIMAIEYGANEVYTVWMWRKMKDQPKWTRRLLTFAPGYVMAAMHIWAGTHNQIVCRDPNGPGNHNCSLLQHK